MNSFADRSLAADAASAQERPAGTAALRLETELVDGASWDRIVAGFDEVCQEQLHAFASIRWPAVRQEPMLFRVDGEVVGGALMMIQRLPLGLGGIAVSKWGPMLRHAGAADSPAIHAAMIEALIAEYAERRGQMLSVLPRASTEAVNAEYERLLARGFRQGSRLMFPNRYIVDLRLDEAAQRKSLSQAWRRQLNKSEKEDLVFEHAGPERIGEFETLYAAMTDRKQFPDHSAYDTVPALMRIEQEALRPELFFVRHAGEVVAGALIFKAGDRAVYLYGATNDRALPLRAGYFMHWHIIGWLREQTPALWYDLGGTDGFQGLHQFKKGMVGDAGVIRPVPPVANYASRRTAYWLGAGAFWTRDTAHAVQRGIAAWRNPKARGTQTRSGAE